MIKIILKALSAIFVSIICTFLYFIGIYSFGEQYHPIDPEIDTEFSATFDKNYFMNIKERDDIDEVIKTLGEPFACYEGELEDYPSYCFSNDGKLLSKSKSRSYWDFAWIGYYVEFDPYSRKVINKYTFIHYD